jgi:hypothetical protein
LNEFLAAKKEFPNLVSDNEVIGYIIINASSLLQPLSTANIAPLQIVGGTDTLAITIKAIFYHLLKTPSAKYRLVAELRSANLTYPAPCSSIKDLPYLDACIKEGLRIHPVVDMILERIVPSTGLALPDGRILTHYCRRKSLGDPLPRSCLWCRAGDFPSGTLAVKRIGRRQRV